MFTGNPWETTAYIGISVFLLIIIFFRKIVGYSAKYLAGLIFFLILAGGTRLHFFGHEIPLILPYEIIKNIPFIASARIPSRNILFVYLFIAIIVAFIIKYLFNNKKSFKNFILLFCIISFCIMFDYYAPIKEKTNIFQPQCYDAINENSLEFGIINLPIDNMNLPYNYDTRFMLHQTYHEIPIANGYISRKINSTLIDKIELDNISKQKKQLTDNNIKYIVIHKNFPTSAELNIEEYKKHYQFICDDSENMVLRIF